LIEEIQEFGGQLTPGVVVQKYSFSAAVIGQLESRAVG